MGVMLRKTAQAPDDGVRSRKVLQSPLQPCNVAVNGYCFTSSAFTITMRALPVASALDAPKIMVSP